tara:strand:- start:1827 stop:2087 length:261 start_codon:yes stop_codon:yes gene_type:complete
MHSLKQTTKVYINAHKKYYKIEKIRNNNFQTKSNVENQLLERNWKHIENNRRNLTKLWMKEKNYEEFQAHIRMFHFECDQYEYLSQ